MGANPSSEPVTFGEDGGTGVGSTLVGNVDAVVGPITFKDEFSDPTVNLSHERLTTDHNIVTGHSVYRDQGTEFVVQSLGRKPPSIEIIGWLTEDQLPRADELVSEEIVPVQTARYVGTAVPTDVDVDYSRVYHNEHDWVFNTTFDLTGVNSAYFKSQS